MKFSRDVAQACDKVPAEALRCVSAGSSTTRPLVPRSTSVEYQVRSVAGRPWIVRLAEVSCGRCVGMDTGSPDTSRKAHIMAQQTTVTLTDDIDGGRAAETVSFGLDGRTYEIDLSKKNAASLRKVLGEFTSSARRVRGAVKSAKPTRHSAPSAVDAKAVREWAQAEGISVSARGRVPSDVVEKYHAAVG